MKTTTVEIGLRLDQCESCLSGEIRSQGDSISFRGWVGLVAALDRLLERAAAAPSDGPHDDQPEGETE